MRDETRAWRSRTAAFALGALASAASVAAAPTYTLVAVDRGALRPSCPAINDAGQLAFAYRDSSADQQPADGVAFWSESLGTFGQVRFGPGEVLGGLVGLTGNGAAVASLTAGPAPDFTGVMVIRPNGQRWTRPPGSTNPMRVTPLAVTERGSILVNGVIDGTGGAFVTRPERKVVHTPLPYLSQANDINDTGAAVGGAWVDSEERFASYWRSPQGANSVLKNLPGVGSNDQTRAYALNNLNMIVGTTILESGRMLATLWDSPSSAPRELSPPAGFEAAYCSAYGINELGEVVGRCTQNNGKYPRAFYWSPETGMTMLTKLLPPSAVAAGAQVLENGCIAINEQGWIAFSLVDEGSAGGVPAVLKPAR